jgi:hypothetical protein
VQVDAAALATTLAAVHGKNDTDGLTLPDGSYIDFSAKHDSGGRWLEIGDADKDAISIPLTRDQLLLLHTRLTLALIADAS